MQVPSAIPAAASSLPTTTADAPPGAVVFDIDAMRSGRFVPGHDQLTEEVPVALEYNGVSHAVMLASPIDLADFALGFSLSEGIVGGRHEFYGVDEERSSLGITLQIEIASAPFARLKERRRTLAGRTGCGLCGTESLAQVAREAMPSFGSTPRFAHGALGRSMAQFAAHQSLNRVTGGVHAAAWCTADGDIALLREDVGRHNALDKLIGALALASTDASTGFIAVTSRASFEMVQKTAMAGVSTLAAVSAPTSLAVTTARSAGMTLAGFVRGEDFVVYSGMERLRLPGA